ncbi:MAG: ABC transporter substrate-binding protein [Alphaproteobacteria bacterium]|nr:ABC transporter substrate-binding protein [Alphaproteobacteria bacterium]
MRRFRAVLTGLLVCCCAGQLVCAEPEKLLLLTEDNPPFNYRDPITGEVKGSSVELVAEIMAEVGIPYDIQVLPWKRAFRIAQEQPNTCLFSMNFTEERKPLFKWVTPFYRGGWAFYQRADAGIPPATEDDIRGRVLIAQTAAATINELKKKPDVTVIEVGTEEAAFQLLMRGRGDYWLAGLLGASSIVNQKGRSEDIQLVMHWRPAEVGMGCSHGTADDVMARLNDANHMLGDRRYAIIQRHF